MEKKWLENFSIIIPISVAVFNIFLILHPTDVIAAAQEGLLLWFNHALPSLLPFVVGANLLAGLGFIHFMGVLTAPIMVPLFKVPGVGAFALLTGFTSGYPMGAKAVANLRETGQIRQDEAQRLMAFSNNAGPLFVVGFVGTGLFGSPRLGYVLLISHIVSAIIVGIAARFLLSQDTKYAHDIEERGLSSAFKRYRDFRRNYYKGFGQALGTSVKNSMESMLLIGGFIIFFCVVIKTLEIGGIFAILNLFYERGNPLVSGFAAGLLEVANGASIISRGGNPNPATLAATAAIISFGGFSVHGQTAYFIRNTDIKFAPYLAFKGLQAIISGFICLLISYRFAILVSASPALERGFIRKMAEAGYEFAVLVGMMVTMAFCISFMISCGKNIKKNT